MSQPQPSIEPPTKRPRFNYNYAYPEWLESHHCRILEAVDRFHLIDTNQLMRLTGWQERRTQHLTQRLRLHHYIRPLSRGAWAKSDGTRQSNIWALLPRGAWLRSLETKTPFDQYRTYQNDPPSPMTAEHTIDLADIRISFELHAEAAGIEIVDWRDEVQWREGEALHVPRFDRTASKDIRPDGSVILKNRNGHLSYLFIEADRTNRNNWQEKIRAYKDLWSSGEFHKRFRVNDVETGFRVLVTTKSEHRADHLKTQAETIGRKDLAGLFLFAPIITMAITANVFTSSIWGRGGMGELQSLYQPLTRRTSEVIYTVGELSSAGTETYPQDCLPNPNYQLSFETL